MENLLLSLNVVLPLLILMLVGMLLKRLAVLKPEDFLKMNRVSFYVTMPAACFRSILFSDMPAASQLGAVGVVAGLIVAAFLAGFLLVPSFVSENARRGVLIQGMCRSNDLVFGLPVALALLDSAGMSLMMITISVTMPLFAFVSVVTLEYFYGRRPDVRRILLKLIKNPTIVSCVLGLIFKRVGLILPGAVDGALKSLADMNTGLVFIVLGGTLTLASLRSNRRTVTLAALVKLVVLPGAVIGLLLLCGVRGAQLAVAMVIFGAPTAVSSFPLAVELGGDGKLAGELVVVTSFASILTMFLWIFLLKQTGVI